MHLRYICRTYKQGKLFRQKNYNNFFFKKKNYNAEAMWIATGF